MNCSHKLHFYSFGVFFSDNNFIKDFPQLADGLMVIPLPVEEQCRGVLSEPQPNLQLLTGESVHNLSVDFWLISINIIAFITNRMTHNASLLLSFDMWNLKPF